MRIALLGAHGQLGTDLLPVLQGEVVPLGRAELDLARPDQVNDGLDRLRPGLVVNTAAYNLVDRAEDEPAAAFAVNALGPRAVATWCGRNDVPLLHFSTDYVFSGRDASGNDRGGPPLVRHSELSLPDPQSVYAASKLAGEHFVRSLCPRHFVVRTCGLYGRRQSGKGNFVETMLRLGRDRAATDEPLRVVDDHWCAPTATADLARAAAALVQTQAFGLYHAANEGATTWRRFAEEIFRIAGIAAVVQPVTAMEYGAKAARPTNSLLDCGKLARLLGTPFPDWHDALRRYLGG